MHEFEASSLLRFDKRERKDKFGKIGYIISVGNHSLFLTGVQLSILKFFIEHETERHEFTKDGL